MKQSEITLLPYQQRWVDDSAPFKLWDADRQIGSTFAALNEAAAHIDAGRRVLWLARDLGSLNMSIEDFPGHKGGDVEWTVDECDVRGRSGVVFVDNCFPSQELYTAIEGASIHGLSARVILSGQPDLVSAWSKFYGPDHWHTTTIMDAVEDGVGRRVAESQDIEWSPAWEFRWLAELADVFTGQPDSPRFGWPSS